MSSRDPNPTDSPRFVERRRYDRRVGERRAPSLPKAAATTILGMLLIAAGAVIWLFVRAGSNPGGQGAVLGAGLVVLAAIAAVVGVLSRLRRRDAATAAPVATDPATGVATLPRFVAEAPARLLRAHHDGLAAWLAVAELTDLHDETVRHVAATIDASLPAGSLIGRLAEDRFGFVVTGLGPDDLGPFLRRLAAAASRPQLGGHALDAPCRIVAVDVATRDETLETVDLDALLDEARFLLATSPGSLRGGVRLMDDETRTALRGARDGSIGDRVEVLVQLQRSLADRSIVGARVTAQVPGGGADGPSVDLGAVTAWYGRPFGVLDVVLAGIERSGRRIPPAGIRLWFEAPAADVAAAGGVEALWARLSKVGLSGTPLGVELTGPFADVDRLAAAVAELAGHGVQVAVAVSGRGAITLDGAASLRPDRLVLDAALTAAVAADDPAASGVARAAAELASSLGAEVVAADVASIADAPRLAALGVAVAQVQLTEPWAPRRRVTAGDRSAGPGASAGSAQPRHAA